MSNRHSPPLFEKIYLNNNIQRFMDTTTVCLLLSLLVYRILTLNQHGFAWLLALLCESCFTFTWVLGVNTKWNQVIHKTYPHRLLHREKDLPAVDMFVTTADAVLEPPLITVNTVISLLAVDYPANKLACYVSDDGCSSLIYYSLVEASKFAKTWVPFCKKYNVMVRAPFRYFTVEQPCCPDDDGSLEFQLDWKSIKDKYDQLTEKFNAAARKSILYDQTEEFDVFANTESNNHPTIIKVILDSKEGISDGLPQLIYLSRQKLRGRRHHYKAGAMNVLTRVSALMTNAPFMLNVDCDMYANNPQVIQHAMCLILGYENERECGFVQAPQIFYDGIKDDPFGNQFKIFIQHIMRGQGGIQGPPYVGTNCFHRRKVIYGLRPLTDAECAREEYPTVNGMSSQHLELRKIFGNSKVLVESASIALCVKVGNDNMTSRPFKCVEVIEQVAGCDYEDGTGWGDKVGWLYGSAAEDTMTGITVHSRGWKSVLITPNPPAFLGCAPSGIPTTMIQLKRWSTGLIEIFLHKNNPVFGTFYDKLQFRQCLSYLWFLLWGFNSIPDLCYAILPAYCIITNSSFMPNVHEVAIHIPVSIFAIYNLHTLSDYLGSGLSVREWWNNQRMSKIGSVSGFLFGFLSVIIKIMGFSETVFEVTSKEQSDDSVGRFTFDKSPVFIPGTTLVLLHITALGLVLFGLQPQQAHAGQGSGLMELLCSLLVLICFWPFVEGLFAKGKYGIPSSVLFKSVGLTLIFVLWCLSQLTRSVKDFM